MTHTVYMLLVLSGFVLLATMLGIFALYAHTIMPALRKASNATFVQAFGAIDRHIINPIFMIQFFGPLFMLGAASVHAYQHQLNEMIYIVLAFACYLTVIAITLAVNVPLNNGIKDVTNTTDPDSLSEARTQFNERKWIVFNHIRTAFTLLATVLVVVAIWVSTLL